MAVKSQQTRAELLREQRERRPRRRVTESKRNSQTLTRGEFPPILVRGGSEAYLSHSHSKGKKGWRRFDIALNGQGVEMRLPSIPVIGIGWRLLSVLLIGILGFSIYFLWSSPFFNVEEIDVTGLGRISSIELEAVANVVGKSIIFVNPQKIEQVLLAAFPEIENIKVETEVPNKVSAKIVERRPVLTWLQDGKTYLIDETGQAYLTHGEAAPSITVQGSDLLSSPAEGDEILETGEVTDQSLPLELVNALLTLSDKIPEDSSLMYDRQHGISWFDSRGWQVYFGSDGDIDLKWKVYWRTFKRLKQAGIRPAIISVEHVHAPYYRLER